MLTKLKVQLLTLLFILPQLLSAQESEDFLRSIGKIYVVVAVICILFLAIVLFLFRIQRKISQLEKQLNNE